MTRRFVGSMRNGWQLLVVAGALQAAVGCGSNNAKVNGTGGTDGGGDGGGTGGKLGGVGGRGTGGSSPVDAANPACAAAPYSAVSAFGAIFDQWMVGPNSEPATLASTVGPDGSTSGTLQELDTTDGNPTNGSVKLTIPFTGPNQTLLFARLYTNPVNMQGATVTAKIKLDMGLITGPTDIGKAFIALKTTAAYTYAAGPDITLDPTGGWAMITASADAPSGAVSPPYTSCDVREIDVVIQTGPTGNYRQAVVHIDTISISYPGVDAGGDDGAADGAATDGGTGDSIVTGDGSAGGDVPADAIIDAPAATDTAADTATGG